MEILRDNYLSFGENDRAVTIAASNPRLPLGTFYEETIKQIKYINENKTKPINLFLSGGLDSEYTIHAFKELNIDANVICYRLIGEDMIYNTVDLSYALKTCKKLNIEPIIYDFNLEDYIRSGKCVEDSKFYNWTHPNVIHYLTFINIVSNFDGCNICSGEFHILMMNTISNEFDITISYNQYRYYQIWKELKLEGTPFFLSYSSEMLFAFLTDSEIIKLKNHEYPGRTAQDSSKGIVYNRGNKFNLEPYNYVTGSRIKLNGHEEWQKRSLYHHPNLIQIQEQPRLENFKEDLGFFLNEHGF